MPDRDPLNGRTGTEEAGMNLSIIIVSYNVRDLLRKCLSSIGEDTLPDKEIIVVDNVSTDGSPDMVKAEFPGVRLVENTENLGFGRANNAGYALSTGRMILFLNPDTVVRDSALEKMARYLDDHDDVGAVSCRLLNGDLSLQRSCRHFPGIFTTIVNYTRLSDRFPGSTVFGRNQMSYWDYGSIRDVDVVSGACMMFRRSLLEEIGLFDERFFMYSEEVDLCRRVWNAGRRIVFIPHAEIVHWYGKSSETLKDEIVMNKLIYRHYFTSRYYYFRKHYPLPYALSIFSLDYLFFLLRSFRASAAVSRKSSDGNAGSDAPEKKRTFDTMLDHIRSGWRHCQR